MRIPAEAFIGLDLDYVRIIGWELGICFRVLSAFNRNGDQFWVPVTRDFNRDRINIYINSAGKVERAYYG